MPENAEVVTVIAPGKSIMFAKPGGGTVQLKAKAIIRAGQFPGVDEAEIEAMLKRGELVRASTLDIDSLPNHDLKSRTPTLNTSDAGKPLSEEKLGTPGLKRDLEPQVLRTQVATGKLDLVGLNNMVRARDAGMAPFDDMTAAINWLCVEYDTRPPAPPAAPPAPPAAPPA